MPLSRKRTSLVPPPVQIVQCLTQQAGRCDAVQVHEPLLDLAHYCSAVARAALAAFRGQVLGPRLCAVQLANESHELAGDLNF